MFRLGQHQESQKIYLARFYESNFLIARRYAKFSTLCTEAILCNIVTNSCPTMKELPTALYCKFYVIETTQLLVLAVSLWTKSSYTVLNDSRFILVLYFIIYFALISFQIFNSQHFSVLSDVTTTTVALISTVPVTSIVPVTSTTAAVAATTTSATAAITTSAIVTTGTDGTTTPHSLLISTPTSFTTPDRTGVLTGAVIACAIAAALLGLLVLVMCVCFIYLRRQVEQCNILNCDCQVAQIVNKGSCVRYVAKPYKSTEEG